MKNTLPPLASAAIHHRWDEVVRLAIGGYDTNTATRYGTPLYLAAVAGRNDVVQTLLRFGADPNVKCPGGNPPLFDAASLGLAAIAVLLLESGASVNATSHDGVTALMAAVANGQRDVVHVLLNHGADPNLRAKDGTTALRLTRRRVRYLPRLRHRSWRTAVGRLMPLDESSEMVRLLLEAGADPTP